MASCEKCWSEARRRVLDGEQTGSVSRVYAEVLKEREDAGQVCTPRERAGWYWDEATQRDTRESNQDGAPK